jgi:exopolysaccharide biosynthesis protein
MSKSFDFASLNNKFLEAYISKNNSAQFLTDAPNEDIFVLKICNSKMFYDLIRQMHGDSLVPKFMPQHNLLGDYLYHYQKTGGDLLNQNITIAVIPETAISTGKARYNFLCCHTNMQDMYKRISSHGVIINGGYFLMPQHKTKNYYNSQIKNKDEYSPIGEYRGHKIIDESIAVGDDESINVKEHGTIDSINGKSVMSYIYDTWGYFCIDTNNKPRILNNIDMDNKLRLDDHIPQFKNIVAGNLLIYNGQQVFTEDKLNTIIVKTDVDRHDLGTDKEVHFKAGDLIRGSMVTKTIKRKPDGSYDGTTFVIKLDDNHNSKPLNYQDPNSEFFFPFDIQQSFVKQPSGLYTLSPGDIPPGIPTHANDLNPRTMVVIDQADNLLLVNILGRNQLYVGMDFIAETQIALALGAKHAINLDGGGSAIMAWKKKSLIGSTSSYGNFFFKGYVNYDVGNVIMITTIP